MSTDQTKEPEEELENKKRILLTSKRELKPGQELLLDEINEEEK